MGCGHSVLPENRMKEYQNVTYLTKKEITDVYKRFQFIAASQSLRLDADCLTSLKVACDVIEKIPELLHNPFNERISRAFCENPGEGVCFEDFLEMMSVFSARAPKELKVEYAFRIYDMDGDDFIGEEDLRQIIKCLIGDHNLEDEMLSKLVDLIVKESDLDEDRKLSFAEFEHVISKSPDFMNTFQLRI